MADEFGDRMKLYEQAEAGRRLMPLLPAIARLDGKCFSSFTKGLDRPYDLRLSAAMIETARYMVEETNACAGYTQSDEITLCWLSTQFNSQIFFDGKIQKMVSVLAAMATLKFNWLIAEMLPPMYTGRQPVFDCRVWNVPNTAEGVNVFKWREADATRNSVSMAAREYYSAAELYGKSQSHTHNMLFDKGINWNNYPVCFKRGTYIQRRTVTKAFTTDEIERLPPEHQARRNPDLMVERLEYVELAMPPLNRVINPEQVLFFGEQPAEAKLEDNSSCKPAQDTQQ